MFLFFRTFSCFSEPLVQRLNSWDTMLDQIESVNVMNSSNKLKKGKKSPRKIPLNAVECEPVETRVLNPNASKASYKPKQRSYRKTKLKFF